MSNINKALNITNALISLPSTSYLLSFMILVGIVFGILASFLSQTVSLGNLFQGSLQGLFLLSIPAILTSILIKLMLRKVPFKRILATSFVGQIIYALAYLTHSILLNIPIQNKEVIIFFAAAFAFVIWFVIARFVFILKWRAFLFAALQIIIYGIFLLTGTSMVSGDPMIVIAKFFVASVVFLAFIYLFFMIINAPMKRTFGLNTLDAVSLFLSHWFYESKELEDEFERVGEEVETFLSSFIFKRKNDIVVFAVPYVHFGPFGNLGGSNFSYLLSEELKKRYCVNAFIFHGTVTHDLNPVSSDELSKIVSSFDSAYKKCKFSKSKFAFSKAFSGDCFAESLIFISDKKGSAFAGFSRAPNTTEDVNFGLGLAMMSEAEKHVQMVSAIDQHNAETGEITSFEPGSEIGFNYMGAISDSLSKRLDLCELTLGVSSKRANVSALGPAGINIAVFSSKPNYAIILIDSNGVKPEVREKIIFEVKEIGKQNKLDLEVGVYTTDTHALNTVRGVLNPIKDDEKIINMINEGVLEAIADMQPALFSSFKERFKIHVLGAKQSIELISTVNAIIAIAKIAAPLVMIGSIVSILWIISKI